MKRLSARLVSMLALGLALVASPVHAGTITVGDFSFLPADDFEGLGPSLLVQNLSGGTGVDDDFLTIDITLVDNSNVESDYGYDSSGFFVAGVPSSYRVVGPGDLARFFFDDYGLNPANFLGAYVTVLFKGEALTTWDGTTDQGTPVGLLPLEEGSVQFIQYTTTAVPEPGTMLLVGAGAALMGSLRRRRLVA